MVTNMTIERDKWGVGRLHGTDGKFCCLGFYGLALGLRRDQLTGSVPAACPPYREIEEAEWLLNGSTICEKLIAINDCNPLDTSQEERERGIAAGFALAGVTVTFTG